VSTSCGSCGAGRAHMHATACRQRCC
jgi:hypothetical protein